ncbi:ribonuclease Z [Limobrevibacterium gyesilva]|uniref:Uncharacterized protein n=1 Tax=Limobrevibacterium gyesilva TaxID=2991712 RepID=A0AA41YLF3_9PROT|nr:hypothetical protein [Limobrevibacterium gyesilva]MCW3474581.1 hypothetical protein [Limobrevibacterium gyesilva]
MRPIVHCHLVNGPFGDPSLYAEIMFERRAMLFDLGDLSPLSPRKLLRVSHAFVSHAHMDHFAGFDRLLRVLLGREKTVAMYGPADFIDRIEHKLHAYTWNVIGNYDGNLIFDVSEVHDGGIVWSARFQSRHAFRREPMPEARIEGDVLASCGALQVRCAVLDHATPCLGFALEERAHVNIWKTRLDELGLEVGPWLGALKRALLQDAPDDTPIRALRRSDEGVTPVTLPLGALRALATVVAGQKIAYVVDARDHVANVARIERLAWRADVLFIECTFLLADAAHAMRKNHLTAHRAGLIARHAQVKRLAPCHFSTRYAERGDVLSEEAQRAFQGLGPTA